MQRVRESTTKDGKDCDTPIRVICVKRSGKHAQPYATYLKNRKTDSKFWGHYFCDIEDALDDYYERCEKHGVTTAAELLQPEELEDGEGGL